MRLFLGLDLPEHSARAIADWRDRALPPVARAVPPANFHITLAFLGEVPSGEIETLSCLVDECCAEFSFDPFEVLLDQPGFWPRPGILWLGAAAPPPGLMALASALRRLPRSLGLKRDRNPFVPHVTLFRGVRDTPPAPVIAPSFPFVQDTLTLFESERLREGVRYRSLEEWKLPARS